MIQIWCWSVRKTNYIHALLQTLAEQTYKGLDILYWAPPLVCVYLLILHDTKMWKKSRRPFLSVLHAEVIKYWRQQRLYCIYTRIPFFPNRTRQKELLMKQVSYQVILKCLFIICRLMPKVLRFSVTITTLHHQHQNLLSHQPALKHLNKKGFHTTAAFTCLGLVCVWLCRHIILYIISCTFW